MNAYGNAYDQAQALREMVERQRRQLKVITVTSGKGGVGKSSMTVNLALALSQMGRRVLVVDADFGLANIDVMLGINTRSNLSHLLRGERRLDELIQQGLGGVRFISGGSGIYDLLRMEPGQLDALVDGLMGLGDAVDLILIDTGAGLGENVLRMAMAATEVVVVATPEPTSILDAYALAKVLGRREGAPPIRLLMNKAESRKEAENAITGFQGILRKYLGLEAEALGFVLFDPEVSRSIKRQAPLMLSQPGGLTARQIMQAAQTLLYLESGPPAEMSPLVRFFSRLRRRQA